MRVPGAHRDISGIAGPGAGDENLDRMRIKKMQNRCTERNHTKKPGETGFRGRLGRGQSDSTVKGKMIWVQTMIGFEN